MGGEFSSQVLGCRKLAPGFIFSILAQLADDIPWVNRGFTCNPDLRKNHETSGSVCLRGPVCHRRSLTFQIYGERVTDFERFRYVLVCVFHFRFRSTCPVLFCVPVKCSYVAIFLMSSTRHAAWSMRSRNAHSYFHVSQFTL